VDAEKDIYGGSDPRTIPIYTVGEVARHLRLPASTVRSWVRSRGGPTPFQRVIVPDDGEGSRLSFRNLVEIHVLSSLRQYDIPLPRVRESIAMMKIVSGTDHPLVDTQMYTDRVHVFARYLDGLITLTRGGQMALEPVIDRYLARIDRDEEGLLRRLYPFVDDDERVVAIDPRRKFGRPYLVEAGVETAAVASRYRAGESVEALAHDFATTKANIEGALRFERLIQQAA
jgi:uncharacterized protein (DUF433 family)